MCCGSYVCILIYYFQCNIWFRFSSFKHCITTRYFRYIRIVISQCIFRSSSLPWVNLIPRLSGCCLFFTRISLCASGSITSISNRSGSRYGSCQTILETPPGNSAFPGSSVYLTMCSWGKSALTFNYTSYYFDHRYLYPLSWSFLLAAASFRRIQHAILCFVSHVSELADRQYYRNSCRPALVQWIISFQWIADWLFKSFHWWQFSG